MAVIAEGSITLTAVSDACSVIVSPSSCVIHADYDGSNPELAQAYADINVIRGDVKLAIESDNVSVKSLSNSGISYLISTVDEYTQRIKIVELPTEVLSGNIDIEVNIGAFGALVSFQFSVVRESSMLDWIQEWESNKTSISGNSVITPRIFAGQKDSEGRLTGVYIGPDNKGTGLYGYKENAEVFRINETGAFIGGWNIATGGIMTEDGRLQLLSEGSIISLDSQDAVIYGLYKSGRAVFAKGNVVFNEDGSADYAGKITSSSGEIGGWNIEEGRLSKDAIILSSAEKAIGILSSVPEEGAEFTLVDRVQRGGVILHYTSANNYGLVGYGPSESAEDTNKVFSVGSENIIGGWHFDKDAIWIGTKNNTASQFTSDGESITIGTNGFRGKTWYINNDGSVSFGNNCVTFSADGLNNIIGGWHITSDGIKTSDGTLQILSTGEIKTLLDANVAYSLDKTGKAIFAKGNVSFNSDGSGFLANGVIDWDAEGNMRVSKMMAVENDQSVIVAGLNGTTLGADSTHGKALFFAGTTGSSDAQIKAAKTIVYEDGLFYSSNAEISGKITATSGWIGGWKIDGNTIINQTVSNTYNNYSAIIFRNASGSIFTAIGTSVLPASSALTALARFENTEAPSFDFGYGANYGVIFSVKNATYNFAFSGTGNGMLDGVVCGFGVQTITYSPSSSQPDNANTNYWEELKVTLGDTIILKSTYTNANKCVVLPSLSSIQRLLGISSATPFHIQLKFLGSKVTLYGRNTTTFSNNNKPYDTDNYPRIYRWSSEISSSGSVSIDTTNSLGLWESVPRIIELFYDGTKYWGVEHGFYPHKYPYYDPGYNSD